MAEKVNPQMLVVARESRGLTQALVAEQIGVNQATLSKYESGLLNVADDDLAALANFLDFPISFFFQTDRVCGFGSACFYHRKRARMPVAELRRIQAWLNIFRFHTTRLLRGVEVVAENRFLRLDVDEHRGPEEVARLVRQEWGVPMGPVSHVVNAVETAGAILLSIPLGTAALDAISQIAPGQPPVIFINNSVSGDRLRFTLMHEVGHVIMHQLPSDDMEGQADRFAAEYLMPAREIKSSLRNLRLEQLPALKLHWKVSMIALVKRAFDLGQLSARRYRSLCTELSSAGWRMHEPVEVPTEKPAVLGKILRVHLDQHGYTIAELSKLVNATENRFSAYLHNSTPTGSPPLRVVG